MQIGDPIPGYYVGMPFNGYPGHRGADFPAPSGTPILAAHDGRARMAGWIGGAYEAGGNLVYLTAHDGSFETSYQHMVSAPIVSAGQHVAAGQVIGYVGSTGYSTGPHLHFELWLGGTAWSAGAYAVDPIPYIETETTPTPTPTTPTTFEDEMYAIASIENGPAYFWNQATGEIKWMDSHEDNAKLFPNLKIYTFATAEQFQTFYEKYPFKMTVNVENVNFDAEEIAKAVNDEAAKRLQS